MNMKSPFLLLAAAPLIHNAAAQDGLTGSWVSFHGIVPPGAVSVPSESARAVFLCRTEFNGVSVVGVAPPKSKGCHIRVGENEIARAPYEILQIEPASLASAKSPVDSAKPKPGVTPEGVPFSQVRLPDGTTRRRSRGMVTLISPTGKSISMIEAQAPGGTAPPLPSDPNALRWFSAQNDKLLAAIARLLGNDSAGIAAYQRGEDSVTNGNAVSQIVYRVDAVNTLTSEP